MLTGLWTYRSYLNHAALVADDANAALAQIFGEGVFDLTTQQGSTVEGALGLGTGYALTVTGTCLAETETQPLQFSLRGVGLPGTATAGWGYDYRGIQCPAWPDAVDQVPCLVGTLIRVKAHGPTSPAGVTASFIAVRHPDEPPRRMARGSSLLVG